MPPLVGASTSPPRARCQLLLNSGARVTRVSMIRRKQSALTNMMDVTLRQIPTSGCSFRFPSGRSAVARPGRVRGGSRRCRMIGETRRQSSEGEVGGVYGHAEGTPNKHSEECVKCDTRDRSGRPGADSRTPPRRKIRGLRAADPRIRLKTPHPPMSTVADQDSFEVRRVRSVVGKSARVTGRIRSRPTIIEASQRRAGVSALRRRPGVRPGSEAAGTAPKPTSPPRRGRET